MTLKNIKNYIDNKKKIPEVKSSSQWNNMDNKNMYDNINYTDDNYTDITEYPYNEKYEDNYKKLNEYIENADKDSARHFSKKMEKDMIDNIAKIKELEKSKIKSDITLRQKLINRQERLKDFNDYIKIYNDTSDKNIQEIKKDFDDIYYETEKKERNLILNTFYEKKYNHQTYILKELTFTFLVLLTICMIYKFGLINDTYFVVLIGTGVAIASFIFVYRIVSIIIKDKTDYDSYDPNIFLDKDNYVNTGDGIVKVKGFNDTVDLILQNDLISSECIGNLGDNITESVNNVVNKYETSSKINQL